ncbi:class 1 isoprenoid biosynthesis enzyme [Paraflavitalea pollutisoli]|uniref:class 1 isoprenoid biosynthesis enzyme n=1 Tax=Paraflavitalea pollutisoli TaxID=3034143 RepID=UPI0023EBB29C|nr:class 1 isoprenoid biosynthesis enzyme [Paraflavitalea sp. H1-2-19X]
MPTSATGTIDPAAPSYATPVAVSYWQVVRRLGKLYWQLKKQEDYFKQHLQNLLPAAARQHQASFTPQQIKRFVKYWQLAHNVVCDNLSQLTGRALTPEEERRIGLLSVFAPLFDDLLDNDILQQHEILQLIEAPDQYVPQQAADEIVLAIYRELLQEVPNRALFTQHLQTVTRWQHESQKQRDRFIQEEELYQITYNKSYYGILLFCAALNHYPSPALETMLYPIAGLMQLTNDAFDVWKDIHKDVYTLPNLHRNFGQLQHQFMAEISSINRQLDHLPYPAAAKANFSITIHALHAMGWMSLQQLRTVTAGITSIDGLKSLTRAQLVCDLDSLPQKFRWFKLVHYFANFHSSLAAKPFQGQPTEQTPQ